MSFRNRFQRFMYGRYGNDNLNYFLVVLYVLFALINTIHPNIVTTVLMIAAIVTFFIRLFSKNIYQRRKENTVFMNIWTPTKNWLILQKNRIKDRNTSAYRTCPKCKAVLRLPRQKGAHTAVCPKCKNKFDVFIR